MTLALAPLSCQTAALKLCATLMGKFSYRNQTTILLQIDVSNAFNSIDRAPILRFVRSNLPEAAAWTQWMLTASAPLYLGEKHLACTTGVQQGDPLGPLLFAAGLHEVISTIANDNPAAWCVWYLDDGTIVGDLAALNSVACRLQEQLATIGLEINVGKCHIMSSSSPGPYSMLRLMHYHAVIPQCMGLHL